MIWMILAALGLGIRHGFDLDHLATIDAMTRISQKRMVGFLFSFGHGLVVMAVSFILGAGLIQANVPAWLDGLGTWISIFFLILFGAVNLWNLASHKSVVGIKSYIAQRLAGRSLTSRSIIGIGALFALSFDTVSQVALFSLSASLLSGAWFSVLLGGCFMLGMMLSDGINGLFVAHLLQRASKTSKMLSKTLGFLVSSFSLTLGCLGFLKAIQ